MEQSDQSNSYIVIYHKTTLRSAAAQRVPLNPEQVNRTVESDQSSTLLPLSDLKTGCGLHEKWARIRITTELCPEKDEKG